MRHWNQTGIKSCNSIYTRSSKVYTSGEHISAWTSSWYQALITVLISFLDRLPKSCDWLSPPESQWAWCQVYSQYNLVLLVHILRRIESFSGSILHVQETSKHSLLRQSCRLPSVDDENGFYWWRRHFPAGTLAVLYHLNDVNILQRELTTRSSLSIELSWNQHHWDSVGYNEAPKW